MIWPVKWICFSEILKRTPGATLLLVPKFHPFKNVISAAVSDFFPFRLVRKKKQEEKYEYEFRFFSHEIVLSGVKTLDA